MISPIRAFHKPLARPIAAHKHDGERLPLQTLSVQFGNRFSSPPVGFEYLAAENPKLAKPVYVGYHPDNFALADVITQTLLRNGLSVIRRNWAVGCTISQKQQTQWIKEQSSHAIVVITPSYLDYTRSRDTVNEFSSLHCHAVETGGITADEGAPLLYAIQVDSTPLPGSLQLPNTTLEVSSATSNVERVIGLTALAMIQHLK